MSLFLQLLFSLMSALIAVHVVGLVFRKLATISGINKVVLNFYTVWTARGLSKTLASNLVYLSVASCVFTMSFQEAERIASIISLT